MNMATPIHALLLDLDGTLIDTAVDLITALHTVQHNAGIAPCAFNDARPQVPNGSAALIRVGFPHLKPEQNAHELEQHRLALIDTYAEQCHTPNQGKSRLYNGLDSALTTWEHSGKRWGIVTNKHRMLTEPLLNKLNLLERIDVLVCGDDLTHTKPNPEPLLHAAKKLGIAPEHCAYLGDDHRDILAARAAKMRALVAAYDPFVPTLNPQTWQADAIIDQAQQLLPAIESLEARAAIAP